MIAFTPIIQIALFYLSGLLLSPLLKCPLWLACGLTVLHLLLLLMLGKKFRDHWKFLAYSIFLVWGLAHPGIVMDQRDKVSRSLAGPVEFSGIVVSDPVIRDNYTGFQFRTDRLDKGKVRLNLQATYNGRLAVVMGERVDGMGFVSRNDSKFYLSRNLFGNLQVRLVDRMEKKNNYWSILNNVRRQVYKSVSWGMEANEKALITGLMLGVREDIPIRITEVFSNTGTIHILAVSGLHLAIITAVIFFITRLFITSKILNYAILTVGVVLYTLLIGDQASILRAALMTELGIAVYIFDREKNFYNVVGLSALLLLFFNPFTVYNIGFQLSYAAVLGMVAFNPWFLEKLKWIPKILKENIAVSFSAQMFVFPMVLVYFHKIVLISFLANVPIVPLSSFNIIMGFVSFFVSLTGWWQAVAFLNVINGFLLKVLVAISAFFAKFFFVKIETLNLPFLLAILAGIAAFFLFINYRNLLKTRLAILGLTVIFSLVGCVSLLQPYAKVFFINAGTGRDAVLVRDGRDISLFIDLEMAKSEKLLKNFLLIHNVKHIRNLVFTAPSERLDECTADLVGCYRVDRIWGIGRIDRWPKLRSCLTNGLTTYHQLERAPSVQGPRVRYEIRNPTGARFRFEPSEWKNSTGNSLVAGFVFGGSGILLAGPVDDDAARASLSGISTNIRWRLVYRSDRGDEPADIPAVKGTETTICRGAAGSTNSRFLDLAKYREIVAFLYKDRVRVVPASW